MLHLALVSLSFTAPLAPRSRVGLSKVQMNGGKGFGGGEATRDPAPTVYDPNDPKGKQQAIHKAESFAEYLAKRGAGAAAAPAAPAPAAAPAYAPAPAAAPTYAPAATGGGGSIAGMLATMDGPDLYWGDKGPLQNPMKEESDFKEFDKYSTFLGACSQHGIDLSQPDITVLAPGDQACAEYSAVYGPLTKAVCAYHVIKGVVNSDSLSSASLTTLEGSTITYRRMFRKHFLDNAITDAMAAPPRSSFKGNIKADNGLIHMLNEVIYPGWTETDASVGAAP